MILEAIPDGRSADGEERCVRKAKAMENMKKFAGSCETCAYYEYDEDYGEYICDSSMDEDDFVRLSQTGFRGCPYYRDGDEYRIARKQ